ncbi:MAG: hypothetical protein ACTHML_05895 [Ginsengibacter sp.]
MSIVTTLPATDHHIPLQIAEQMTDRYRANYESILAPEYRGKNLLARNETFNRAAIEQLLSIKDCAGMRIYYGMDDSLQCHAILVGVNESNEDILPLSVTMQSTTDDFVFEEGQRCPDFCPPDSPLNK